jgi:hypothetical protein
MGKKVLKLNVRSKIKNTTPTSLSKLYDQLFERMVGLVDEIIERKANTLAGLTVQTRALQAFSPEHFDENMVNDPRLPDYLRSLCNVLGLPLPPPVWRGREEAAS